MCSGIVLHATKFHQMAIRGIRRTLGSTIMDHRDWISPRTEPKRSTGLSALGLFQFVPFELLKMVRMWIRSIQLFPEPAELEPAYFSSPSPADLRHLFYANY